VAFEGNAGEIVDVCAESCPTIRMGVRRSDTNREISLNAASYEPQTLHKLDQNNSNVVGSTLLLGGFDKIVALIG
jgi:hypothetical protein